MTGKKANKKDPLTEHTSCLEQNPQHRHVCTLLARCWIYMTVRRLIRVIACNCTCPRWNGCSCFSCLVNLIDFSCYSDLLSWAVVLCKTEEPYCTASPVTVCYCHHGQHKARVSVLGSRFIHSSSIVPFTSLQKSTICLKTKVWALNTAA